MSKQQRILNGNHLLPRHLCLNHEHHKLLQNRGFSRGRQWLSSRKLAERRQAAPAPPFTTPSETHLSDTARSVRPALPKNAGVKNPPEIYGSPRRGGSHKHGEVCSRRTQPKARRARPLPGCPGRAPAPSRPAGGQGGCLGAEGRRQPPRGKQGPAADLPRPRRGPPTTAATPRTAPPGPRSYKAALGPAPAPAPGPPLPGSPPPLERLSPPAARAPRAGPGTPQRATEPEAPGATQLPRR